MKIRKSQLRQAVNETVQAFFVTPQSMGMVGVRGNAEGGASQLEEDDIDKNELKNIIGQIVDDVQNAATSRMQSGAGGRVDHTGKLTEISGVDSLKPNDPRTPGADDVERDAADDVMEAGIRKNKKVRVDSSGDEYDGKVGVIHKVGTGKQKGAYVVKMPDGSLNSYNEDELVMEAAPQKGGRPRGAPHIENVRFWDLPESSLKHIIADASDAVKRLPMARKAGKWADEVNDAVTVLHWRKKKGIEIKEEFPLYSDYAKQHKESFNAAPYGQGKEQASVIGTNEAPEVGSLAKGKRKEIVQKMHKLVKDGLGFKSIENVQPIDPKGVHGDDGVAFIFGDAKEGRRFANYLKKQRSLGKVVKMRGDRLMVSMYY